MSRADGRPAADLILRGGRVLTMDAAGSCAEAVAIRDGLVLAAGRAGEIDALAGPGTRTIDIGGRTVIPGIIDTHAHMEREGLKTIRPSLAAARSIDDVLEVVRSAATAVPAGEWVVTMPVGQPPFYFGGPLNLRERRMPAREELDRAASDHPVCIAAVFGNWGRPPGYTALNSLALARLGIDRATEPTGPNVEIERTPDGEPTGVIVERNNRPTADFTLLKGITGFGLRERVIGLERSMALYNAVGTTSVYEGHGSSAETIAAYRELWERGAVTVRSHLCVSPSWTDPSEARAAMRDWLPLARGRGFGDAWLRVSGVFIGWGGSRLGAAGSRAALPNTGWAGFVEWANDPDAFRQMVTEAAQAGLRVSTIVVDDLEAILGIYEDVDRIVPLHGRRWVIEHLKVVEPAQMARIRALGLHVTTIPVYAIWKNGEILSRKVADLDRYVPHAAMFEAGIRASAGTDNIPYNPFFTIQTLVTRRERTSGSVYGPTQRLDVLRALRLMTSEAAHATFEEDVKGSIEAGKLADLAVLSDDPMRVDPEALGEIRSELTLVGGRVVHDSGAVAVAR